MTEIRGELITLLPSQQPTGVIDQPLPVATNGPAIQDLVMADVAQRKQVGIERYGRALQAHNGRDALQDLYEELLDAVMYTRQLIEERNVTRDVKLDNNQVDAVS
jgi:hypothetical protein